MAIFGLIELQLKMKVLLPIKNFYDKIRGMFINPALYV